MKLIFSGPGNVPGVLIVNPEADTCYCIKGTNACDSKSATVCVAVETCPGSCSEFIPDSVGITQGKLFDGSTKSWNANGFFTYDPGNLYCSGGTEDFPGIICSVVDLNPIVQYQAWSGQLPKTGNCSYSGPQPLLDEVNYKIDDQVMIASVSYVAGLWHFSIAVYGCSLDGTPTGSINTIWHGTKCGTGPRGTYTKIVGSDGGCSTDPEKITFA